MKKVIFRIERTKPGKTLLWLWLKNSLSKMPGEVGIDLAGGGMLNKCFFKTDNYICVDMNQIKLDEGKKNHPDAVVVNSTIQEYLDNTKNNADVIICVQTMGVNMLFQHDETFNVICMMYEKLKINGNMIFNIGSLGIDINVMEKKLSKFFHGKFQKVDKRFYGAFDPSGISKNLRWEKKDDGSIKRINKYFKTTKDSFFISIFKKFISSIRDFLSLFIAILMHFFPPLRTAFGIKKHKIYFCCEKKL
tara:strand:- start:14246 stop:14989 length:744 start_codon:yes stop_codon:yes gene_type:complete